MNPCDLSFAQAAARLRDGRLTAVALTEAHLERIAARRDLHAFVAVSAEAALAAAARADAERGAGRDRGPLHGLPLAVKDLVDVEGFPTLCGARGRPATPAVEDAEVVRLLRAAGAVPLGKLATYEHGLVGPSFDGPAPPAVNPWDPARITGGSSSGGAAAVADGLLRAAIGTDTGGSARSPAAYCGVVGLKPTRGRVSLRGVRPVAPSLDHVGVLAATVEEAALVLDAIADPGRPAPGAAAGARAGAASGAIDGLRIGYARAWFADDPALQPEVLRAVDDAASLLSLLGARIVEVEPPDAALLEAVGAVILHAEALAGHEAALREAGEAYGRAAFLSLASGAGLDPGDAATAHRAAAALREQLDALVFARCDALLTASALTAAPLVEEFRSGAPVWTPMRTLAFNVTGHPALALPAGFVAGLPVGAQVVGRAGDEAAVCRIGAAFELNSDHSAPRLDGRLTRPAGIPRTAPFP